MKTRKKTFFLGCGISLYNPEYIPQISFELRILKLKFSYSFTDAQNASSNTVAYKTIR